MHVTYTKNPDGSTSASVKRLQKVVITKVLDPPDPDPLIGRVWTLYVSTLVSFDGVTWQKDAQAERRRIRSSMNLHGESWYRQKIEKTFDIAVNPGVQKTPAPVILPVTHRGSPILGKDKGKKHHLKKNLKRQKEQDVRFMKPVHRHLCHGKSFVCSCPEKWKKRRCGGSYCLIAVSMEEAIKETLKLMKGDSK